MLARYFESGLKATSRTPKVCSDMAATGTSLGTSFDMEKINTRGLYPVSPTANHFPSGLNDRHVAALILSLAVHVFPLGLSSLNVAIEEGL
jgi:hypothetical protein